MLVEYLSGTMPLPILFDASEQAYLTLSARIASSPVVCGYVLHHWRAPVGLSAHHIIT